MVAASDKAFTPWANFIVQIATVIAQAFDKTGSQELDWFKLLAFFWTTCIPGIDIPLSRRYNIYIPLKSLLCLQSPFRATDLADQKGQWKLMEAIIARRSYSSREFMPEAVEFYS